MPYLNRLLRLRQNTFFNSWLRFFNANFTHYENAGSSAKPSLSASSAQRGMFISFIAVRVSQVAVPSFHISQATILWSGPCRLCHACGQQCC